MPSRERRKRKQAAKSEAAADVEVGLVKRSRAEAVTHKPSEDLFVIDAGPAATGKSARELKQDLVLARKLKAADKAVRHEQAQKHAKQELRRQTAKAARNGVDLQTQLTSAADAQKARAAQREAHAAGLYDIWDDASAAGADPATRNTLTALKEPKGNQTDSWVDGVLKREGVDKNWRRAREANPKARGCVRGDVGAGVVGLRRRDASVPSSVCRSFDSPESLPLAVSLVPPVRVRTSAHLSAIACLRHTRAVTHLPSSPSLPQHDAAENPLSFFFFVPLILSSFFFFFFFLSFLFLVRLTATTSSASPPRR
jgi:hypothetical protein